MLGLSNFFSKNQSAAFLKAAAPLVAAANAFSEELKGLSDEAIRERLAPVRARAKENGATLEEDIPLVFALVREAARRTRGETHFDVQLIGGLALLRGKIAEMRTGEGKTLVATLAGDLPCARGEGRANRHRQRLPCASRHHVDGSGLRISRPLPSAS
jgi:preprotein translocase subunit SecA